MRSSCHSWWQLTNTPRIVRGHAVEAEESAAFVEDARLSIRRRVSYFSQIVPFHQHDKADSTFRIEKIVGIEGDARRGRKPFPHPFPARMPLEVAQAAISALSRPGNV